MTRAPILSAVAAALLLGLAAAGPLAAEDAATPAPSATPAPAKGEFDNSCAMGLAEGQTVKTDCSVNWAAPDGKVYCFSSENSKATFLKNVEANIKKAQDFRAVKASAAASGVTKNFTEQDVNAAVKTVIDGRSKDGAFVFRDPKLNADLNLIFEQIKIVRGMEGHGWFANTIFHDKENAKKQYALDFWFKPDGGRRRACSIGPRASRLQSARGPMRARLESAALLDMICAVSASEGAA